MEKFPHYLHPGDPFGEICASFYHNCRLCASRGRDSESGQLAGGGRGKILDWHESSGCHLMPLGF